MGWTPKQSSAVGDVTVYEGRLATAEAKLTQINDNVAKQQATLKQGLQVVNADQAGPFNVMNFKGRTLVNLGAQQTLESAKNYLFYSLNGKAGIKVGAESAFTYGFKTINGQTAATYSLRDDFKGKVVGSTVEVPHVIKQASNLTYLANPSEGSEVLQATYPLVDKLDSNLSTFSAANNDCIAQRIHSFNVIEIVERKFGIGFFAGCSTVAQKVQRLKGRLSKITYNWYGFGSGPSGNNVTAARFNTSNSTWVIGGSNTNANVSKISGSPTTIDTCIDTNGFFHVLAYAEASNGTVASTVQTDFVDIELEYTAASYPFKSGSRLYEITAAEKNKMDAMTAAQRDAYIAATYPFVEDVKHIWAPVIQKSSKNLLPPFMSGEWTLHANAKALEPYKLELVATGTSQASTVVVPVIPGANYTISGTLGTNNSAFEWLDASGAVILNNYNLTTPKMVTAPTNAQKVRLVISNGPQGAGTYTSVDLQLELGTVATPFEPQNNDYLFFPETKLAASLGGSVADAIVQRDGGFVKVKRWEKDILLDGSVSFSLLSNNTGYKALMFSNMSGSMSNTLNLAISKYDGKIIERVTGNPRADTTYIGSANTVVNVANSDSGFGETYSPTTDEMKAYFNGWQAKTVDANGKPTAWRNIVDGVDAPTQTLDYVKANRAPGYTPYKLTYQLATSVEIPVAAEGAISLHTGGNQIDVGAGVVVREKANPQLFSSDNNYYINSAYSSVSGSVLKNKVLKFLGVYRNGNDETKNWSFVSNQYSNGVYFARIPKEKFDPTAEYIVTYIVQETAKFTSFPTEFIAQYNSNLKTVVGDIAQQQSDLATRVSINNNEIIKILARLKAGGIA